MENQAEHPKKKTSKIGSQIVIVSTYLLCAITILLIGYFWGVISDTSIDENQDQKQISTISHEDHKMSDDMQDDKMTTPDKIMYTCPMHPKIVQDHAGTCPICKMALVEMEDGGGDYDLRSVSLSKTAKHLADIQTTTVIKKLVDVEVSLIGKLDYDETRLKKITARFPGRIDRMFVDYSGIYVKKGDHLVEIYSPDLLTTQQELIQAIKAFNEVPAENESLRSIMETSVKAVREKLRLWDLTPEQIKMIESKGEVSDRMTINSPIRGMVIEKDATEGTYIKTGNPLYTIADLSQLWLVLEAYESDLKWLRYGQNVEFQVKAYPAKTFSGKLVFIDPILNNKTRTVKVRINVKNEKGMLKPGMFVDAKVKVQVGKDAVIASDSLAGKYISPMHPEIIKDQPGICDVCGMDLIPAEEMGIVRTEKVMPAIVIPASAPLLTGKRAIVYVQQENPDKPDEFVYIGKEIILTARAGDYYIVKSGLAENEEVVTYGSFKIDSDLQIKQKPSMMSPEGGGGRTGHEGHGEEMDNSKHTMTEGMKMKSQTNCPVMGGKINKDIFADHKGLRVYFCCPACIDQFKADPEKYLKEMREKGIEPEKIPNVMPDKIAIPEMKLQKPQTKCPVMGGDINRDLYVDYNGQRVYFCCNGCEASFNEDPEKYIKAMVEVGIEIERVHTDQFKVPIKNESTPLISEKAMKAQTKCPVMGGDINKDLYVDYKGLRVYFCCDGCQGTFNSDPEKYLKEMKEAGVEPEKVK